MEVLEPRSDDDVLAFCIVRCLQIWGEMDEDRLLCGIAEPPLADVWNVLETLRACGIIEETRTRRWRWVQDERGVRCVGSLRLRKCLDPFPFKRSGVEAARGVARAMADERRAAEEARGKECPTCGGWEIIEGLCTHCGEIAS